MARPKSKFCITYEIVTPESAEDGEFAEIGWYGPGGWTYPLSDTDPERQARLVEARSGDFDLSLRDAFKSALRLGVAGGGWNEWSDGLGFACYTSSDDVSARDGSVTRYCLHGSHLSAGSVARIRRLLGCGRTS
jgi:hypothetical protein